MTVTWATMTRSLFPVRGLPRTGALCCLLALLMVGDPANLVPLPLKLLSPLARGESEHEEKEEVEGGKLAAAVESVRRAFRRKAGGPVGSSNVPPTLLAPRAHLANPSVASSAPPARRYAKRDGVGAPLRC
jgi:hypothetical protein